MFCVALIKLFTFNAYLSLDGFHIKMHTTHTIFSTSIRKNTSSWHFNPRLSLKNVWICSRLDITNGFAMQISVARNGIHVAQETQCESKLLSGNVHRNECTDYGNSRSSNTMTKYNSVVQHRKCNNYVECHSWFHSKLRVIFFSCNREN